MHFVQREMSGGKTCGNFTNTHVHSNKSLNLHTSSCKCAALRVQLDKGASRAGCEEESVRFCMSMFTQSMRDLTKVCSANKLTVRVTA